MKYSLQDLKQNFNFNFNWINEIKIVCDKLKNWKFVGGCVRDSLYSKLTYDIDIVTTLLPNEVEDLLSDFNITTIGKRFGTIGVFYKGWTIEITTTRKDINTNGRHTDVLFCNDFYIDSLRRDFTINALLFDGDYIIDYHNGLQDLINNNLKFIGNPEDRITEDYLRIIRYIRFFIRFDMKQVKYIDEIKNNINGLQKVSIERIINEMLKMCENENILTAFQIMNNLNISNFIFKDNLFYNFNIKNLKKEEILALSMIQFKNWNKLPIPRLTRKILDIKHIFFKDIYLSIAYIWYKKKEIYLISFYILILKYSYNINFNINMDIFHNFKNIDLNEFQKENRTKAEIFSRYLYLNNKTINIEQIKDLIKLNIL